MKTSKCFATDGTKMENKPFVGFPSIDLSDVNDDIGWKFRIAQVIFFKFA
jgi:hypothetical protein